MALKAEVSLLIHSWKKNSMQQTCCISFTVSKLPFFFSGLFLYYCCQKLSVTYFCIIFDRRQNGLFHIKGFVINIFHDADVYNAL